MGHNCGGCLALSTQQPLRVQEMTFVQSPRYSPDGDCLSVAALFLFISLHKELIVSTVTLNEMLPVSAVHRCIC